MTNKSQNSIFWLLLGRFIVVHFVNINQAPNIQKYNAKEMFATFRLDFLRSK